MDFSSAVIQILPSGESQDAENCSFSERIDCLDDVAFDKGIDALDYYLRLFFHIAFYPVQNRAYESEFIEISDK